MYLGVQIFDPDPDVKPKQIQLQWPGDVFDLKLPASGFYHVNGTNAFYLHAKLSGLGKCFICLVYCMCYPAILFTTKISTYFS